MDPEPFDPFALYFLPAVFVFLSFIYSQSFYFDSLWACMSSHGFYPLSCILSFVRRFKQVLLQMTGRVLSIFK